MFPSLNTARHDADFDTHLGTKNTDNLTEGTANLYYTEPRFDTSLAAKTTDNISEGIANLFYTSGRFDSDFASKSTSDLSEGSNLYYTDARADGRVNSVLSTWAGTSNINSLGTITSGIWNAASIGDPYIASAATWNAKQNAITLGTSADYLKGDLSLGTFDADVDARINLQKMEIYEVVDLTARDALTGMKKGDIVVVAGTDGYIYNGVSWITIFGSN